MFQEIIDVNKPIQETLKKKSDGNLGSIHEKLEKVKGMSLFIVSYYSIGFKIIEENLTLFFFSHCRF